MKNEALFRRAVIKTLRYYKVPAGYYHPELSSVEWLVGLLHSAAKDDNKQYFPLPSSYVPIHRAWWLV